MPLEFLTNKELCELTEYKRRPEQRRELMRLGIRFEISRTGRPLVLKETVIELLSGKPKHEKGFVAPDLKALERIR